MDDHGIDQCIILQGDVGQTEFGIDITLGAQNGSGLHPDCLISCTSRARPGGFFRYSIISGSTPRVLIIPSTVREVLQLGL